MSKKIIGLILFFLPSMAFAHPGHGGGFGAAFAHPFTGIDHLLMMLCVGIFAGRAGGNARWQLPTVFIGAMIIGWFLGVSGYTFSAIESGIAAGLMALGLLFVCQMALPFAAQLIIVGLFASLHGMAHGVELTHATPFAAAAGFVLATALLHIAGLGISRVLPHEKFKPYRVLGVVLTVIGGGLLATV